MKYLKLAFWLPVAMVILVVMYLAWLGGRATSHEWKWLTLIAACYALMMMPLLHVPAIAGVWTVILVKQFGLGGYDDEV